MATAVDLVENFFGQAIRHMPADAFSRLSGTQLHNFVDRYLEYESSWAPGRRHWLDSEFSPYVVPTDIGSAGPYDYWHDYRLAFRHQERIEYLIQELSHWLLYSHRIVIDNPLQFIILPHTASTLLRDEDESSLIYLMNNYLSFLVRLEPLIRHNHLVLAEQSWRWLEAMSFFLNREKLKLDESISNSMELHILDDITKERLSFERRSGARDSDGPDAPMGRPPWLDADLEADPEDRQAADPLALDGPRASAPDIMAAMNERHGLEWAGVKSLSEMAPPATSRESLSRAASSIGRVWDWLRNDPEFSPTAASWLWHSHARMLGGAHLGTDLVVPDSDHEDVYRKIVGGRLKYGLESGFEPTIIRNLLSVNVPRLGQLDPVDMVRLREDSELFEDWRLMLRIALRQVDGALSEGKESVALESALADQVRGMRNRARRSPFMRDLLLSGVPFVVGGISYVVTGNPVSVLSPGAAVAVASVYGRWHGRRVSESEAVLYRHHTVFDPLT